MNVYFKSEYGDFKVDLTNFKVTGIHGHWLSYPCAFLAFQLICPVPDPMCVMPLLFSSLPGDVSLGSQV